MHHCTAYPAYRDRSDRNRYWCTDIHSNRRTRNHDLLPDTRRNRYRPARRHHPDTHRLCWHPRLQRNSHNRTRRTIAGCRLHYLRRYCHYHSVRTNIHFQSDGRSQTLLPFFLYKSIRHNTGTNSTPVHMSIWECQTEKGGQHCAQKENLQYE